MFKPIYPWPLWDKILEEEGVLYLDRGEHFNVSVHAMNQAIRSHFSKKNLRVSILHKDGTLKITEKPYFGRKYKYPWKLWLDGNPHTLIQFEDFEVSPVHLARLARYMTKHSVSLTQDPFTKEFTICALPTIRPTFRD